MQQIEVTRDDDGTTKFSLINRAVQYWVYRYKDDEANQWQVVTNRTNVSFNSGGCTYYRTLAEVAASRKCLRGIDTFIQAHFAEQG